MKQILGVMSVCASLVAAGTAAAQVGTIPSRSPFIDVEQTHEITPLFGYFSAKRDPAAVAPQSGLMGGLQYEWRASGPLHLGTSVIGVKSARTTMDPSLPAASRDRGTNDELLIAADAFLGVSMTGERSWHRLMPMATVGLGLITDNKGPDVGGFKFGTRFAFPWSAGIRWVPGSGRWQLRADAKDWMYTIKYPQAYYSSTTSDPAIIGSKIPTSRWTNNFAMTVGLSYAFNH